MAQRAEGSEPRKAKFHLLAAAHSGRNVARSSRRLADGSVLHLNTDSVATVRFDTRERLVMLTSGQAEFDVAHEQHRAFRVLAGSAEVIAVGCETILAAVEQSLEQGATGAELRNLIRSFHDLFRPNVSGYQALLHRFGP